MPADVFLDDSFTSIQAAFDNATDGVVIHNTTRSGTPGKGTSFIDIQTQTIKLVGKGTKTKPFQIIGVDSHGNEVKALGDDMPIIVGNSAGCVMDTPDNTEVGIFYIEPGEFVEIRGLHLKHEVLTEHGSATIVNEVNNSKESTLTVENCWIETMATTAISNLCKTASNKSQPATHDIAIRGCQITGKTKEQALLGEGNYSSVNLGYGGTEPLNMSGSTFEVSGSNLDTLIMGVAVWNALGDSSSLFVIAGNSVGFGAETPVIQLGKNIGTIVGTGLGISFISPPTQPLALPNGTIAILENKIKVGRYFVATPLMVGAAGVVVHTNNVPQVRTVISRNVVEMTVEQDSNTYMYHDGILYECEPAAPKTAPEAGGAQSVTAYFHDNEIFVPSGQSNGLRCGIRVGAHAHLVRVTNNQLNRVNLAVESTASRNTYMGNSFAKICGQDPAIFCDGFQNSFSENDFTESDILGSKAGNSVCVSLGQLSYGNVVVLEHRDVPTGPDGTDPDHQWINDSTQTSPGDEKNVIVVIPNYQDAPSLLWARSDAVFEALKEFQFRVRHIWPRPSPGPPVSGKMIPRQV